MCVVMNTMQSFNLIELGSDTSSSSMPITVGLAMKGQLRNYTGHREEILLLAVHRKEIYIGVFYITSTLRVCLRVHCKTWVGITSRNVSETCVQLNRVLLESILECIITECT